MREYVELTAYTDAASFNNGMKVPHLPEHSASAGIILYQDIIIDGIYKYNPNSSISYGELYAIYNILKETYSLIETSNRGIRLILHSDSAYCVQAINIWMKGWKRNSRNGCWFTSSGVQVAYQEMLEAIDEFFNKEDFEVTLKHISGHIDFSKKKHRDKAKERYRRFNSESVSDEDLEIHTCYNDICDLYAKKVLKLGMRGCIENEGNQRVFKKYFS